ncbi:hypothetical protein [Mesobacillus foraminis]|nr:hypothetical protein [Mesobacillus foraminis]
MAFGFNHAAGSNKKIMRKSVDKQNGNMINLSQVKDIRIRDNLRNSIFF